MSLQSSSLTLPADCYDTSDECVICYEMVKDKAFVNDCLHTFCYTCIIQWTKVKAVCPLCVQPVNEIIKNVRSIYDYDIQSIEAPVNNILTDYESDFDRYSDVTILEGSYETDVGYDAYDSDINDFLNEEYDEENYMDEGSNYEEENEEMNTTADNAEEEEEEENDDANVSIEDISQDSAENFYNQPSIEDSDSPVVESDSEASENEPDFEDNLSDSDHNYSAECSMSSDSENNDFDLHIDSSSDEHIILSPDVDSDEENDNVCDNFSSHYSDDNDTFDTFGYLSNDYSEYSDEYSD